MEKKDKLESKSGELFSIKKSSRKRIEKTEVKKLSKK